MRWLWTVLCGICFVAPGSARGADDSAASPEAIALFEQHVRPVLAEHCWQCHGEKKQEGELRLDSREGALRGSYNGPVIVPGEPKQSPLVAAIGYEGDVQMPPTGKLPQEAIDALTVWVAMGAPWPEEAKATPRPAAPSVAQARGTLWSLQPVRMPPLPNVSNIVWCKSPIDRFILARLEAAGIVPSPAADKRSLIRRATYDLIGLPPEPEEVEAFIADEAPDAYGRLLDRLLDSPHYGERWGRYWLDVARYADTKGYVYDSEEKRFPFSYVYRDYVIQAFNADLPYDQFLVEQIAADSLVAAGADRRALAGMGFLTLGRRFTNNIHDVIDDRLDCIFRGTQGLTIGCARCHDHKFDAIATRDYYALYGVLANVSEKTVRLDDTEPDTAEYRAYVDELSKRRQELNSALETKRAELSNRLRAKTTDYLVAVLDAVKQPGDDFYVILSADDINASIVRRWQEYLLRRESAASGHEGSGHGVDSTVDPVWAWWFEYARLDEAEFAAQAAELTPRLHNDSGWTSATNPRVTELFASPPQSMREVAERYGALLTGVHADRQQEVKQAQGSGATTPGRLADDADEQLRSVLYADDAPTTVPPVKISEIETYFDESTRVELKTLEKKIDQWQLESPATPPHAHVLEDSPLVRNARVLLRGNPKLKGDEVPRRFLPLVAGEDCVPFDQGGGRLELARAIASPDNPLTARVLVNRVWQHHFGTALVRTPSDFGVRSEPPTHPELLDYLARRFMDEGWSIKRLHRWIMLSNTYRQTSADDPVARGIDPENRLLWRMNRRRLDFEAFRDTLLMVGGRLDRKLYGRPFQLTEQPSTPRRTIYAFIDRQDVPAVLRVFDFASPDLHSPQRSVTSAPQQALFMLNSPFVIEQSRALAARGDVQQATDTTDRIRLLYRICCQREPTTYEVMLGHEFVEQVASSAPGDGRESLGPWEQYAQGLLAANELVFVD